MAELVVRQDVAAPVERVWSALVDWELHGEWMLLTRASGGAAVGESIEAFTGIGRVGFLDRMTIVVWEPPRRAVVRHTGRVVRGSGAFEVRDLAHARHARHRGAPPHVDEDARRRQHVVAHAHLRGRFEGGRPAQHRAAR